MPGAPPSSPGATFRAAGFKEDESGAWVRGTARIVNKNGVWEWSALTKDGTRQTGRESKEWAAWGGVTACEARNQPDATPPISLTLPTPRKTKRKTAGNAG